MEVRDIQVSEIKEPWHIHRPVDKTGVEWMEFVASIRPGLLLPVGVNLRDGEIRLVWGNRRLTAFRELGLLAIPAVILYDLTDEQEDDCRRDENLHRKDPTVLEWRAYLKKLYGRHPGITQREVGKLICKSPLWVGKVLALDELSEASQRAVERGEISLAAGYELAKVRGVAQEKFLEYAVILTFADFKERVREWVTKGKEAARKSDRHFFTKPFKPIPHYRALKETVAELELPGRSKDWYAALKWVLNIDDWSLEEQKSRWETRQMTQTLERED